MGVFVQVVLSVMERLKHDGGGSAGSTGPEYNLFPFHKQEKKIRPAETKHLSSRKSAAI